jgi:phosphatidylinositol-3-phosphatase
MNLTSKRTARFLAVAIALLLVLSVEVARVVGTEAASRDARHKPTATARPKPTSTPTTTPAPTVTPTSGPLPTPSPTGSAHAIKAVFVIVMENHDWSQIKGSASAPYINGLLARSDASYATQYFNPPSLHPSEPNYVWLEAGGNTGLPNTNTGSTVNFTTDNDPSASNSTSTTDHLVTYLTRVGVSWKSYQEDITGTSCPLTSSGLYAAKHNPFVFFQDVTNNNSASSSTCVAHERPYSELVTDLTNNTVARYNFITPNLCDDMHNSTGCATRDSIKNGDTWLSNNLPTILNSQAYKDGGAVFLTWDEAASGDGPIGMVVLSPEAKGNGYNNTIHYTHSSTVRTIEEIFGASPLLRDAQNATDLSDLFRSFP